MLKTMKRTMCLIMCSYICFTANAVAKEDWTQVRRYTHHSDLQQQWFNSLSKDLKVTDSASILDYGSRDGKFTSQLALSYPNATMIGVESDQNMLSWAKRRYPSEVFKNVQFESVDTLFQGQRAGTIDHIISVNRLYREAESSETLSNLHRVLKKGEPYALFQYGVSSMKKTAKMVPKYNIHVFRFHAKFKLLFEMWPEGHKYEAI